MNKTQKHRRAVTETTVPARGEQARALAAELRRLAANLERQGDGLPVRTTDLVAFAVTVATARRELDRVIGTPWLTDPALELLLSAFVAENSGSPTGSEAAFAAVPHTAKRWVAVLEQSGLLEEGSREGALKLSQKGRDAVCRYLEALVGTDPDSVVH